MTSPAAVASWAEVLEQLRRVPALTVQAFDKARLPHPLQAGARASVGLLRGQSADYRWKLPDCSGLHAEEFADRWEAHIDSVDPACDLGEHLRRDAPQVTAALQVAGGLALLALTVALIARCNRA